MIEVDGRYLSSRLVEQGLARIYGKRIPLPDGTDSSKYLETLAGLEEKAKQEKKGAWGLPPIPERAYLMEPHEDAVQRFLDDAMAFVQSGEYIEDAKSHLWFSDILEAHKAQNRPADDFGIPELTAQDFTQKRLKMSIGQIAGDSPERFTHLRNHLECLPATVRKTQQFQNHGICAP